MSQTTAKPTLVPEGPIVVSQESALGQFVRSVRDRMSELDVSTHGQVLALYGGRGTGKTSALLTLLRLLRDEGVAQGKLAEADRSKQIEWLLPIRFKSPDEPENSPKQLFAPEYGRVEDDLLFMLLAYLEARYQPLLPDANHRLKERSKGSPLARIRGAEVRRRMPDQFFAFEKDSSVSSRDLPRRLVGSQIRVAKTTARIHEAFRSLFDALLTEPKNVPRRLILFVDDLDLQPQRALDLLELIQLFLLHPRVLVVLTADREQLLHSLAVSLHHREAHQKGDTSTAASHFERLAQALLRKWVPIEFSLPRPSAKERWHFRPQSVQNAESIADRLVSEYWQTAQERFPNDSLAKTAEKHVTPLLPDTYRGLIYLHNRIGTFDKKRWVSADSKPQFGLEHAMVEPFLSLLLSIEVRQPELALLDLLSDFERSFLGELKDMVALETPMSDRDRDRDASLDDRPDPASRERSTPPPNRTPLLSERLRPLRALELLKAHECLVSLAQSWYGLSEEGTPRHLFYISLNSNAQDRGQTLPRETRYDSLEVLELTEFAKGGRADPEQLRHARAKATDNLPKLALLQDSRAPVDILAKAQLPLLLWLGFKLRYLRRVTMFNDLPRGLVPFEGPPEPIHRPASERAYLRLQPVSLVAETAESLLHPQEALVVIDFLGRSQPEQLDQFQDKEQQSLRTKVRTRLVPMGEVQPLSSNQQLYEVMTDVLQYLYQLQDQGIKRFHLAVIGPDVLAFFLGQQLNAWTISLYEFYADQSQYLYVFDLSE